MKSAFIELNCQTDNEKLPQKIVVLLDNQFSMDTNNLRLQQIYQNIW